MEVLIITNNTKEEIIQDKVNIVLTNNFYSSIRKEFSINKKEILSYCPSLFKNIYEDGDVEYRIINTKDKEYLIIAFNKEKILNFLNSIDIKSEDINTISFIDELNIKDGLYRVNENEVVFINDGMGVVLDETEDYSIKYLKVGNKINEGNSISIKDFIDTKEEINIVEIFVYLFSITSIFFILLISFKHFEINRYEEEKALYIERMKLPQTMMQISNINKTYKEIVDKSYDIKNIFYILSTQSLMNDLVYFKTDKKAITLIIKNKNIKSFIKRVKDDGYKIEVEKEKITIKVGNNENI